MNQQDELQHFTGEIEEPPAPEEGFEGRYDHEPMLQKLLRKAYQLRQACIAIGHKDKELSYNPAKNILTCEGCGLAMDLNPMVDAQLRVRRIA